MNYDSQRHDVAADTTLDIPIFRAPFTVSVSPVTGGTVQVSLCAFTSVEDLDDLIWHPLFDAPVTAATLASFPGPVRALRVTTVTEAAVVEVTQ